jgi:hypothetical protein
MDWNPEVTVAAVVMRDARFLMVEERIGRAGAQPAAGHLEDRETLLEPLDPRRPAKKPRGDSTHGARRHLPVAQPARRRGFLRFAFCGDVDDHPPSSRSTAASCARLDDARRCLRAAARLRSPLVMRCIEISCSGSAAARLGGLLDLVDALRVDAAVSPLKRRQTALPGVQSAPVPSSSERIVVACPAV